jgi:uncharacterized SAM-binding protein YcdF (DUF218 family)
LFVFSGHILAFLGENLVYDEKPVKSDAVVVLLSGVEYYPRLIEAANLYKKGLVSYVVINGNRKTEVIRSLEKRGFKTCCSWYEDSLRVLSLYGVHREKVIWVSVENAYDTVSEAKGVGTEILQKGISRVILTTSKYHTKRASFIWKNMYKDQLSVIPVSAKSDPYDPKKWWKNGRQIRWVLAEYGAWVYYFWKKIL